MSTTTSSFDKIQQAVKAEFIKNTHTDTASDNHPITCWLFRNIQPREIMEEVNFPEQKIWFLGLRSYPSDKPTSKDYKPQLAYETALNWAAENPSKWTEVEAILFPLRELYDRKTKRSMVIDEESIYPDSDYPKIKESYATEGHKMPGLTTDASPLDTFFPGIILKLMKAAPSLDRRQLLKELQLEKEHDDNFYLTLIMRLSQLELTASDQIAVIRHLLEQKKSFNCHLIANIIYALLGNDTLKPHAAEIAQNLLKNSNDTNISLLLEPETLKNPEYADVVYQSAEEAKHLTQEDVIRALSENCCIKTLLHLCQKHNDFAAKIVESILKMPIRRDAKDNKDYLKLIKFLKGKGLLDSVKLSDVVSDDRYLSGLRVQMLCALGLLDSETFSSDQDSAVYSYACVGRLVYALREKGFKAFFDEKNPGAKGNKDAAKQFLAEINSSDDSKTEKTNEDMLKLCQKHLEGERHLFLDRKKDIPAAKGTSQRFSWLIKLIDIDGQARAYFSDSEQVKYAKEGFRNALLTLKNLADLESSPEPSAPPAPSATSLWVQSKEDGAGASSGGGSGAEYSDTTEPTAGAGSDEDHKNFHDKKDPLTDSSSSDVETDPTPGAVTPSAPPAAFPEATALAILPMHDPSNDEGNEQPEEPATDPRDEEIRTLKAENDELRLSVQSLRAQLQVERRTKGETTLALQQLLAKLTPSAPLLTGSRQNVEGLKEP